MENLHAVRIPGFSEIENPSGLRFLERNPKLTLTALRSKDSLKKLKIMRENDEVLET